MPLRRSSQEVVHRDIPVLLLRSVEHERAMEAGEERVVEVAVDHRFMLPPGWSPLAARVCVACGTLYTLEQPGMANRDASELPGACEDCGGALAVPPSGTRIPPATYGGAGRSR